MLKKWGSEKSNGNSDSSKKDIQKDIDDNAENVTSDKGTGDRKVNNILKGCKVTGNINVTCDMVLSGDVEGNIM